MLYFITRPLSWLLEELYGLIGNYGITLIVFTVIIRLLLYPLYKKQILSMSNMGDMSKKMKELQRKYADDREMLNIKMAEYYKESGVSPMGGCLPMLVSSIILMILFTILRNPLIYMTSTDMKFAVHEGFLWMKDLSQPDLWILPVITGLATYFAFVMNQRNGLNGGMAGQEGAANGMNAVMKYIFPIMLTYMARSYPAGLAIYWSVGQVTQIFFNIRFNQIKRQLKEEKERESNRRKIAKRA